MNTFNESVNHNDLIERFKDGKVSDKDQQAAFKALISKKKESWDERLERITKQFSSESYQQSILK